MYRQGQKRHIILEVHCYKDNHDLHTTFGILQFHPGIKIVIRQDTSYFRWRDIVFISKVKRIKLSLLTAVAVVVKDFIPAVVACNSGNVEKSFAFSL